jgi:hypothetical protein
MPEELKLGRDFIFKLLEAEGASFAGIVNASVLVFIIVLTFAHSLLLHVGAWVTSFVIMVCRVDSRRQFRDSPPSLFKMSVTMAGFLMICVLFLGYLDSKKTGSSGILPTLQQGAR